MRRAREPRPARAALSHFLVILTKGPSWDHGKPRREQAGWDEHASFMDGLVDEAFVLMGGPVGDDPHHADNVLLVVHALTEEAIRIRVAKDPWLCDSTLTIASIEPWTVWLSTA